MIRDLRRIILGYVNEMRRLERFRDYVYSIRQRRMLADFEYMNLYCKCALPQFPYLTVNKRVLCLEGFYLPLFIALRRRDRSAGDLPSQFRLVTMI